MMCHRFQSRIPSYCSFFDKLMRSLTVAGAHAQQHYTGRCEYCRIHTFGIVMYSPMRHLFRIHKRRRNEYLRHSLTSSSKSNWTTTRLRMQGQQNIIKWAECTRSVSPRLCYLSLTENKQTQSTLMIPNFKNVSVFQI